MWLLVMIICVCACTCNVLRIQFLNILVRMCGAVTTIKHVSFVDMCGVPVRCLCVWMLECTCEPRGGRLVSPCPPTLPSTGVTCSAWPHMALNTGLKDVNSSPHAHTAYTLTLWAIFPSSNFYLYSSHEWRIKCHFGVFLVPSENNHFFISSESIYTVKHMSFVHL